MAAKASNLVSMSATQQSFGAHADRRDLEGQLKAAKRSNKVLKVRGWCSWWRASKSPKGCTKKIKINKKTPLPPTQRRRIRVMSS